MIPHLTGVDVVAITGVPPHELLVHRSSHVRGNVGHGFESSSDPIKGERENLGGVMQRPVVDRFPLGEGGGGGGGKRTALAIEKSLSPFLCWYTFVGLAEVWRTSVGEGWRRRG